jgi:hypothetical protein
MAKEQKTFRELYAEQHHFAAEKFEKRLMYRTMHLNALLCYPFVQFFYPNHYALDREYVRRIGACRTMNEAKTVHSEYASHPYNKEFARKALDLRISKTKVLEIASQTFPPLQPEGMTLPRRTQMPNTDEDSY